MRTQRLGPAGLVLLSTLATAIATPAEELIDAIAAQVGSDIVLVSEVLALTEPMEAQMLAQGASPEDVSTVRADILDRLIERRLIEQVVKRAELQASDAEVDQAIEQIAAEHGLAPAQLVETVESQGMGYEAYRERIRGEIQQARVVAAMVTSRVRVEDREIESLYYKRYSDQPAGGRETQLRHILVTFDEEAGRGEEAACADVRQARARIADGEPFEIVASEVSEVNPQRGGDIGWVHDATAARWMAKTLESLETGQVSDVIPTGFGCNLIQVIDRRTYARVELEDVRNELHQELFTERTEEKFGEWVDELRAQTYIERKNALAQVAVKMPEVAAPPAEGGEDQSAIP